MESLKFHSGKRTVRTVRIKSEGGRKSWGGRSENPRFIIQGNSGGGALAIVSSPGKFSKTMKH